MTLYSLRPPFFYRIFSPDYLLCRVPVRDKSVFLTFDDGPVPEMTPWVLGTLATFGVKATFFCVGDNVKKYPGIYDQVIRDGHAAGNHTFHHLDGWRTPPGAYLEDVRQCSGLVRSGLFRPPYGRITPSQYLLLRKHYRIILWSLLSADFDRRIRPEQCLENLTLNLRPGDIIVCHDNPRASKNLEYALPRFLRHALDQGYRFETLPPTLPCREGGPEDG